MIYNFPCIDSRVLKNAVNAQRSELYFMFSLKVLFPYLCKLIAAFRLLALLAV